MNSPSQSGAKAEAALSEAIERLWDRFLPEIKGRVAILEETASAVADESLPTARREEAQAAAHKLAGVLGTFNLTRGTVLARELEMIFSREGPMDPDSSKRLAAIVAELRATVEGRRSGG